MGERIPNMNYVFFFSWKIVETNRTLQLSATMKTSVLLIVLVVTSLLVLGADVTEAKPQNKGPGGKPHPKPKKPKSEEKDENGKYWGGRP